jgi:hypothetical protein
MFARPMRARGADRGEAIKKRSSSELPQPSPPTRICDIVRAKESTMFNWLVRLWHKIDGWWHPHQAEPSTYRRSNLHGRYR